ncbi:uncharacterized protein [Periplaneta americana]|uniref:uncharacterized protein isoform X2 n=1 Tax=Periplaneta americana TaxID=6978 RepID=UPI0037E90639
MQRAVVLVGLLLTVHSVADADADALPTAPVILCHYQENGTKPCELFDVVGCENVISKNKTIAFQEHEALEVNKEDYVNMSFLLPFSEGYLGAKDGDLCWKFKVDINDDVDVILNLDMIPLRYAQSLRAFGDAKPDPCTFFNNSRYTSQVYKSGDFKFTFHPGPEIKEVKLDLIGGECNVTCNGSESACNVVVNSTYMSNSYRDNCALHTKTERVNPASSAHRTHEASFDTMVIFITTTGVITLIVVVTLFATRKIRSYSASKEQLVPADDPDPPRWECIRREWATATDFYQRVILLLYTRDCPEFCEVVGALRQLLQNFAYITVVDPFEEAHAERVSRNTSGWVTEQLGRPHVKLLLVVSEGARLRQQALLSGHAVRVAQPHCLDPLFTLALRRLHDDPELGNDYRRIYPVRFSDFTPNDATLSLITPLKCYVLEQHLSKLILELRNFSAVSEPSLEDIRQICPEEMNQLSISIEKMKIFCTANPDYIRKQFSLVKSM